MADESFWMQFLANGSGAAVGAIAGAVAGSCLTYGMSRSIVRQQIRQEKLERCITLTRDIKNTAFELVSPVILDLLRNNRDSARLHLRQKKSDEIVTWCEELSTLIEVHAPELERDAHTLYLKCQRLHFQVGKIISRDLRFIGRNKSAELGRDTDALLKEISSLVRSFRSSLMHDARMSGWWAKVRSRIKRT